MRQATVTRTTAETSVRLLLNLDGGDIAINTGIGFFDHMLIALAKHAGWGLTLETRGDLQVDSHHTVEDTGIVLGQALREAVGDKAGIHRYASCHIPMDEALAFACVDVGGRSYLSFDAKFPEQRVGELDSATIVEFMRALALNANITLHLRLLAGANTHHMIEALFKALAHAFRIALAVEGNDVLSTKGSLD